MYRSRAGVGGAQGKGGVESEGGDGHDFEGVLEQVKQDWPEEAEADADGELVVQVLAENEGRLTPGRKGGAQLLNEP